MRAALPRRLRRRLADAIVAAVRADGARRQLAALGASREAARAWCGDEGRDHGDLVQGRAQRAVRALASVPVGDDRDLGADLHAAAALFDAGLYFETHEVLEPHWRQSRGERREALQGLIQIAVGYEHWVQGNLRGARALLAEGSARVRGRCLQGIQLDVFAGRVSLSGEHTEAREPAAPPFPRPLAGRADSP